jgi:hypothetical protein
VAGARAYVLSSLVLVVACGLEVSGTATPPLIEAHDASSMPDASSSDAAGASPIKYLATATGKISGSFVITANDVPTDGELYVAAIATKPFASVTSVIGGPSTKWERAAFQCGEDNQTGIEVWFAKKTTDVVTNFVTASLSSAPSAPKNAVVAVSVYTGVSAIGNVVYANSNGGRGSCDDGGDGTNEFSLEVLPHTGGLTYGAIAVRQRTVYPGDGNVVLATVRSGDEGDAAALTVLESRTNVLRGTLNAPTGWALIGGELLP